MLNVHPVNKNAYYGHAKRYSRTNANMGNNFKICAFWPPGAFSDTYHITATAGPFSKILKIGTLSELIVNQSQFGRKMANFGNAMLRPPGHGFGFCNVGTIVILKLSYFGRNGEVCVIGANLSRPIVHGHGSPRTNQQQQPNNEQPTINTQH